jgi:hypothetical protein
METGTCLRCGAPYEEDATVCYTCGAPIGETKTPTQPVRAVKTPAKPEPEPAPELVPAVSLLSRPAVQPPKASPTTPGPSASATRSRRHLAIAFATCALVLLVLAGAAYAVRAITAPPPVATQTTYHDPQHRFSFQRPALWQVTTTATGANLTDASGTSTAVVTVSVPQTPVTAAQQADTLATQMGLQADASQTFGGQTWEQRSGQVTGSDGAVRQTVVLVTLRGGALYTLVLASPVASFSALNNAVYQPLLASFAFG